LILKEAVYVKEKSDMGFGIFAARDISKDEIIIEFKGPRVKIPDMTGIPREVWDHLFNVGVDEYIIAREPAVRTNHSCDPNAGIFRDALLAAMRDIKKGEEITFDYSTITADNWTLECGCGSPLCRKIIGNYADLPDELKRKYDKYTPDWIKALRNHK
jgi:SET domain-containing protein